MAQFRHSLKPHLNLIRIAAVSGVVAVAAIVAIASPLGPGRASADGSAARVLLLPDPVQLAPTDVALGNVTKRVRDRHGRKHFRTFVLLGFTSTIANIGQGPLVIDGIRKRHQRAWMRADQLIKRDDGSWRRVRGVGRLEYDLNEDHSHWHLVNFDTFWLRTLAGKHIGHDSKQGFCIGDRAKEDVGLPGAPQQPVYTGHCKMNMPHARHVRSGFSVGWGDDYPPMLEGQSIDVTKVPAGTYCLEHKVMRGLHQTNRANDVAVTKVTIDPKAQPPAMTVGPSIDFRTSPAPSCRDL